jgi:hypothetical protein
MVARDDVDAVANRFYKGVEAFERASKTIKDQPLKYGRGFREYVSGDEARTFAEFTP